MVRLLAKVIAFVPAMSVMMLINYTLDPGSLYRDGCESLMAESIVAGNNIGLPVYFDDRLVQERVIERFHSSRDVIVLGSSRGMQLRASHFPGSSFFNHSVTAGKLEDFLAIFENYVSRDLMPRLVVLELDPWTIHERDERPRSKRLETEYRMMCRLLGLPPRPEAVPVLPGSKYAELASPNYFHAAVRLWIANSGRFRRPCDEIARPRSSSGAILNDGSLRYSRAVLEQPRAELHGNALRYAAVAAHSFTTPGQAAQRELEAFVAFLRAQGADVLFVLPPFHPVVTDALRLSGSYSMFTAAEEHFRSLAHRYSVAVLGSYDPAVCGCSEAEFIDGLHPTDLCVSRIVSEWSASLAGEPRTRLSKAIRERQPATTSGDRAVANSHTSAAAVSPQKQLSNGEMRE